MITAVAKEFEIPIPDGQYGVKKTLIGIVPIISKTLGFFIPKVL